MPQKRRPDGLAERARRGGLPMQLAFATCHLVMHLGTAVCLMLLLELATETFIRLAGCSERQATASTGCFRSGVACMGQFCRTEHRHHAHDNRNIAPFA